MPGMKRRNISCGSLEKEVELVVWELWWRSCVNRW